MACILGTSLLLIALGLFLLWDASTSTLTLFLFPCCMLAADLIHALVQLYLQRAEQLTGGSDALYYTALIGARAPMLQARASSRVVRSRPLLLCDRRSPPRQHEGCRRGAAPPLHDAPQLPARRREPAERFRDASEEELEKLDDCCAICRETMKQAKVLPCGHYFHYSCLRSWLEQSHSCPVCRASLVEERRTPSQGGASSNGEGNAAAFGRERGERLRSRRRRRDARAGVEPAGGSGRRRPVRPRVRPRGRRRRPAPSAAAGTAAASAATGHATTPAPPHEVSGTPRGNGSGADSSSANHGGAGGGGGVARVAVARVAVARVAVARGEWRGERHLQLN